MSESFFDYLQDYLRRPRPNPAPEACTHLLASRMPDGVFFCPSCGERRPYPFPTQRRG